MATNDGAPEQHLKTVQDYVGDMVSLESHIEEALDRQLKEVQDHPGALAAVQRFHDMVKHNRDHMTAVQDDIGTTGGNPIAKAGSAVLGAAAGMIDKVRSEAVSKALRDDYTAFNLAAVSYAMLHTTSSGLGFPKIAEVCEEHLRAYASAIQEINHLIPDVVAWELEKDGHAVRAGAAVETNRVIEAAWQQTSSGNIGGLQTGAGTGITDQQMPGA
jgi:ferritin-like metal-binding protein YciE